MNQGILERLIIDRAFGELPPDVSALLDHSLEREPALADEAVQTEEILDLAKAALAPASELPLQEPDFENRVVPFPTAGPGHRQPILSALGMAACLALGLFVGRLVPHAPDRPSSPPPSTRPQTVAAVNSSDAGFWSVARYRSAYSASSARGNPQVIWKSPVRTPEIKP